MDTIEEVAKMTPQEKQSHLDFVNRQVDGEKPTDLGEIVISMNQQEMKSHLDFVASMVKQDEVQNPIALLVTGDFGSDDLDWNDLEPETTIMFVSQKEHKRLGSNGFPHNNFPDFSAETLGNAITINELLTHYYGNKIADDGNDHFNQIHHAYFSRNIDKYGKGNEHENDLQDFLHEHRQVINDEK